MDTSYCWILDSGGAGRGAWQGGVIHEFMRWCREHGSFPSVTMGASAGGYAAADVATGTEQTVMKGWSYWGTQSRRALAAREGGRFRAHLHDSILYVMQEKELSGVFQEDSAKKLLVFTTRARRRDGKRFGSADRLRFFLKSATRKLPRPLKYLPERYREDPVIFAVNLPLELRSECIRPLTRKNYHAVIEASCLVPLAMGSPLLPENLDEQRHAGDLQTVFMDGGYALKMPMRLFEEDPRFQSLAQWVSADKMVIFCCDPGGWLWETSARLRRLNTLPSVIRAVDERRLLIVSPDHRVEAGFLCLDHAATMRTFHRGQEQAWRLLRSERVRAFFGI
jgi:predicted acylesterase/phospholipase RssA